MAKKSGRESYLKDPVGSRRFINEMPSGLQHCADSQGNDRYGRVILRYGSPGSPLENSPVESSGYMGRAPRLLPKFQKKGQR